MPTPDTQLCAGQSRQVAASIREEIVSTLEKGLGGPRPTTRLSAEQRRQVAETIREEIVSALEKVLGGRRPFTLATTVRLEQALGVSLRKGPDSAPAAVPGHGDASP